MYNRQEQQAADAEDWKQDGPILYESQLVMYNRQEQQAADAEDWKQDGPISPTFPLSFSPVPSAASYAAPISTSMVVTSSAIGAERQAKRKLNEASKKRKLDVFREFDTCQEFDRKREAMKESGQRLSLGMKDVQKSILGTMRNYKIVDSDEKLSRDVAYGFRHCEATDSTISVQEAARRFNLVSKTPGEGTLSAPSRLLDTPAPSSLIPSPAAPAAPTPNPQHSVDGTARAPAERRSDREPWLPTASWLPSPGLSKTLTEDDKNRANGPAMPVAQARSLRDIYPLHTLRLSPDAETSLLQYLRKHPSACWKPWTQTRRTMNLDMQIQRHEEVLQNVLRGKRQAETASRIETEKRVIALEREVAELKAERAQHVQNIQLSAASAEATQMQARAQDAVTGPQLELHSPPSAVTPVQNQDTLVGVESSSSTGLDPLSYISPPLSPLISGSRRDAFI